MGYGDRRRPRLHVQLGEDRGDVLGGGPPRDEERGGDLLVRLALSQQAQHVAFAGGEPGGFANVGVHLGRSAYVARLNGAPLDLSPREFHLMLELAREPGVVVPKGALAQRLEPLGDALDFGAVEVHISNLRRKIGAERIRTVRGIGYRFAP